MRVLQLVNSAVLGSLLVATGSLAVRSSSKLATSTTCSVAPLATHTISVGLGSVGFSFIPQSQNANVGDTIKFQFFPQNHSVARAEFLNPCVPYEYNGGGRFGFWSGFEPVTDPNTQTADLPAFSIKVNDTEPIFFYCSAPQACISNAMIGVINPNATQTLAQQILSVQSTRFQLSPGEPLPAESLPTLTASSSPTPVSVSSGGGSLSSGAIVGIVVCAVVVLVIVGLALYLWGRNCNQHSSTHPRRYSSEPVKLSLVTPSELTARKTWTFNGQLQHPTPPEISNQEHLLPEQQSPFTDSYNSTKNLTPSHFRIQSSPTEIPWSPDGFRSAPRQHTQVPEADARPKIVYDPVSRQTSPRYGLGRALYTSLPIPTRSPLRPPNPIEPPKPIEPLRPHKANTRLIVPNPLQQRPQSGAQAY